MPTSGETTRYDRADSPESVLFAETSILPLALKEINENLDTMVYSVCKSTLLLEHSVVKWFERLPWECRRPWFDPQSVHTKDFKLFLTLSHIRCIPSRRLWKHLEFILKNVKWRYNYLKEFKTLWQKEKLLFLSNFSFRTMFSKGGKSLMPRRLTRIDTFRLLWIFCFRNHYSIPLRRNMSAWMSLCGLRRLICHNLGFLAGRLILPRRRFGVTEILLKMA